MNGIFIKEMDAVPRYMAVHPMQTMFSTSTPGISDTVSIPAPAQIALQRWLLDDQSIEDQ